MINMAPFIAVQVATSTARNLRMQQIAQGRKRREEQERRNKGLTK